MLRSHRAAALLGSLVAIGGALGCDATDGTAARTAGDRDGATAMAADASARGRDGGGDADSGPTGETPTFEVVVEGVATWRNDAIAAYTIVHDDTCDPSADRHFTIVKSALAARGLVASFGAIVGACEARDLWDELQELVEGGHEIANHSWSHPDLTMASDMLAAEIGMARATLDLHLAQPVTFFIFPYDQFDDGLIEYLRGDGYLGARAGTRGVNAYDASDDLRIRFDTFGPGYSIYGGQSDTPCADVSPGQAWSETTSACRMYVLDQYVDDAMAEGGWAVRELHSVEGHSWEPVPASEYDAHLDYVKRRIDADELWMDTATNVIRYRRAREACAAPRGDGRWLVFEPPSPTCAAYATALTWLVRIEGEPLEALHAEQAGAPVAVRALGSRRFVVDANPALGNVTLVAP